mmetsp:Transcript_58113/g.162942  ORF Transcript_58113/g.162942 Transcript_58113/m.162942 type:complete len:433 (-) Transcript_58113:690-1988(-)
MHGKHHEHRQPKRRAFHAHGAPSLAVQVQVDGDRHQTARHAQQLQRQSSQHGVLEVKTGDTTKHAVVVPEHNEEVREDEAAEKWQDPAHRDKENEDKRCHVQDEVAVPTSAHRRHDGQGLHRPGALQGRVAADDEDHDVVGQPHSQDRLQQEGRQKGCWVCGADDLVPKNLLNGVGLVDRLQALHLRQRYASVGVRVSADHHPVGRPSCQGRAPHNVEDAREKEEEHEQRLLLLFEVQASVLADVGAEGGQADVGEGDGVRQNEHHPAVGRLVHIVILERHLEHHVGQVDEQGPKGDGRADLQEAHRDPPIAPLNGVAKVTPPHRLRFGLLGLQAQRRASPSHPALGLDAPHRRVPGALRLEDDPGERRRLELPRQLGGIWPVSCVLVHGDLENAQHHPIEDAKDPPTQALLLHHGLRPSLLIRRRRHQLLL